MKLGNSDIEKLPYTREAMEKIRMLYYDIAAYEKINNDPLLWTEKDINGLSGWRGHALWLLKGEAIYGELKVDVRGWIRSIVNFDLMNKEIMNELTPYILSGEENATT